MCAVKESAVTILCGVKQVGRSKLRHCKKEKRVDGLKPPYINRCSARIERCTDRAWREKH